MAEIVQRIKATAVVNEKNIPLLVWSRRVYTDDGHGNRTELGPMFFFFWTNQVEIEENDYVIIEISEGYKLALSPGIVFQSGSERIELREDRKSVV